MILPVPARRRPALLALGARAVGALALGALVGGCSTPEIRPGADTAAAAATAPAATPPTRRPPQVDPETREALQREYRELALKNDCSRGFKDLDGTWRFIGQSRTPNLVDTLTITGTRFTEKLSGDPDGQHLDATLTGEIRCLFKNRVLVMIDKVEPEGAFENRSGDHYPCDLLGDVAMTGNKMLMICFYDWDLRTAAGVETEYERVVKPE